MGVLDLIDLNRWVIQTLDPAVFIKMKGQYNPDNGVESGQQPNLSSSSTAGSEEPTVVWVGGGSRTVRFSSRLRSLHSADDIRGKIRDLERLRERDPLLGRAPRVSFAWGDTEVEGFVSRLRIVKNGHWVTGLPKEALFDLEVTSAPDPKGEIGTGETQYVYLVGGETFETLGYRYLGDPLKGELIRRINPKIAGRPEEAGDRVKVLEKEHPKMRGEVKPLSPPFLDKNNDGVWATVVDALGVSRGSTENGLSFDQLPEVVAGLVVI